MNLKTSRELAEILGVSVRQVQRLTMDGVIEAVSNKRPYQFDLDTVAGQYCAFLTEKINAQAGAESSLDLALTKLRAEVQLKRTRVHIAQMELDDLEGQMHRAEDVEAITNDHVMYLRSLLMAMPGKLAADLAGDHTASEQAEVVQNEVYSILNKLANYQFDPDEYQKRLRERTGLSGSSTAAT